MHIVDATSIEGHLNKAAAQDFSAPKAIPLSEKVGESIAFASTTDLVKTRAFWGSQPKRVDEYVDPTKGANASGVTPLLLELSQRWVR